MMRVLLIAYTLTGPKAKYTEFFDKIKESAEKWWHYLDSVWLVKTDKSANEIGNELGNILKNNDPKDHVLVIEVVGFAQGLLTRAAWDWINQHVEK